jgi:FG-GAP repeat
MRTILSFIHQNYLSHQLRLRMRLIGPLVLLMAAALFTSGGASYQAPIDWTFTQIKKLTPSDGGKVGDFGCSVGFYGDTAIVGASMENIGSAEGQGSAYIFERNKGGSNKWRQVKKLTASDGAAEDYFGSSVAIFGDTVVVGAFADKIGRNEGQGSAYIFKRNQGEANKWAQVRKLIASDSAEFLCFGASVAIYADTAVVGVGEGGAAYVVSPRTPSRQSSPRK